MAKYWAFFDIIHFSCYPVRHHSLLMSIFLDNFNVKSKSRLNHNYKKWLVMKFISTFETEIAQRQTASTWLNKLTKAEMLNPQKFGRTPYFINYRLMEILSADYWRRKRTVLLFDFSRDLTKSSKRRNPRWHCVSARVWVVLGHFCDPFSLPLLGKATD